VILPDGFHDVPPGKLATVVTHLEMRAPAAPRPVPDPDSLRLAPVAQPDSAWYRDLFRRVGGEDWLWFSRLTLSDQALTDILHHPEVTVLAVMDGETACGLLELDFREAGACELAFFGLTRDRIGAGAGRWLMNHAIRLAWERPINRFHVHTCTLDSPAALPFYIRSGFVPQRQQVEIADDPRLTGKLPASAGPHVPLLA
jgi:GNAT superfamily N-acetyltransferase